MPLSTDVSGEVKARYGLGVSEWPLLLLGPGSCHPGRRNSSPRLGCASNASAGLVSAEAAATTLRGSRIEHCRETVGQED